MRKAQVDLTDKEFEDMCFFRFKKNWTVQRLLRRALLHYINTDPLNVEEEKLQPETKEKSHE